MIKRQFTLYMDNKPGALAKVARMLGDAKINIEGISIAVTGDVGLIQLVVSNAVLATRILKKSQIPYTVQQVSVVVLPNQPGALAAMAEKLAARKINLNYLYATTGEGRGCKSTVVVSGDNMKQIEKLCK